MEEVIQGSDGVKPLHLYSDSKTDKLEGYDEGSYGTEFISAGPKN